MKCIFSVIALFWFCNTLSSQGDIDFISPKFVAFISEDRDGIWLASAGHGWNYYRGIDTKHYLLNGNSSGLKGSYIQSKMYKTNNGNYWSSTYGFLTEYDPKSDQFQSHEIRYNNISYKSGYHVFHYDSLANLLYCRAENQLFTYDCQQKKIETSIGESIGNSFCTWGDTIIGSPWLNGEGFEIWSRNNTVWHRRLITKKDCPILNGRKVIMSIRNDHNLWLLTEDGLIDFNFTFPQYSKLYKHTSGQLNALLDGVVFDNFLIMGTDHHGIVTFDLRKLKFYVNKSNKLGTIDQLFIDNKRRIWASDYDQGVSILHLDHIVKERIFEQSEPNWVVFKKSNGLELLLNPELGFQISKDDQHRKFTFGKMNLPINFVQKMVSLDSQNVLLASRFDCYKYNWKKNSFTKFIIPGKNQFLHLSVSNGKLSVISDNKYFEYSISPKLKQINSTHLKHALDYQFNYVNNDTLQAFGHSSSKILLLKKDLDTLIDVGSFVKSALYVGTSHYVATNNGIFCIDEKLKITHITKNHPILQNLEVNNLQFKDSWLYCAIGKYICRIHIPSHEIQIANHRPYTKTPMFYEDENKIFIAENNIEKYDMDDVFDNRSSYSLLLESFTVNNRNENLERQKFSENDNDFLWKFYINDVHLFDQCKILYRILPIDTTWKTVNNGGDIRVELFKPSQYTLEVKGMFANGSLSNTMTYTFDVCVSWYNSKWFYLSILSSIVALLFGFYTYRINEIKKSYEIEKRISHLQQSALQSQMNPHFIFNCLGAIQNYIMLNQKEDAMDYLSKFAKLIRQNLNASAENVISLDKELDMLRNYMDLERLRFTNRFEYTIDVAEGIIQETLLIPPLLLQPFIENAILHGLKQKKNGGLITVQITQQDKLLTIVIKDNGIGIQHVSKSTTHDSKGVSITQKRLDFINQSLADTVSVAYIAQELGTQVEIKVLVS